MIEGSIKSIGYIRVSTTDQVDRGVSLDAQEAAIKSYCTMKGMALRGIIRDEGESGKDLRRKGVQEVISAIGDRDIQAVVIYKLDRLARNTIDFLSILQKMDKAGVSFHSITEQIDTNTAMGKFFITVLAAFAQMERDLISERVTAAMKYKRSVSGAIGHAPYGFKKVGMKKDAKLVKVEKEQKVLELIVTMRRGEGSYTGIAYTLNQDGIKTRSGGKWYPETIKSIILHYYKGGH